MELRMPGGVPHHHHQTEEWVGHHVGHPKYHPIQDGSLGLWFLELTEYTEATNRWQQPTVHQRHTEEHVQKLFVYILLQDKLQQEV